MRTAFYIAAACCFAFVRGNAQLQTADEIRNLVNDVRADSTSFYTELPFEYNGEIIIKATLGGETYDFLFDTGGYTMIDVALQQKNNFTILARQQLNSTNGLSKETDIVFTGTFDIGGLQFDHVKAYCIDLANSPKLCCLVNGGIIGSSIIKNYIWQIDYPNRKIIITDNLERLHHVFDATRIPVFLNPNLQPYFMSKVNGRSQWLMFDTGCASLLWMGDKDAQKFIKDAPGTHIIGGSVETHHGRVSDTLSVFRADCEFNDLTFAGTPAYYRDGSGLTLFGNPVIKDYIVTLNFAEGEMYLKPIQGQSPVKGWESFGFTVEYEETKHKIATVIAGTEAEKSGLVPGDIVTGINGQKITCNDFCSCFDEFSELQEKSYEMTISILKNNKPKQVKLKKMRVF